MRRLSAQEGHAQKEAAAAEAAGALAAAQQQCAALQQELAERPAQEEMQALRQRVEALRLMVDSREEEADAAGERSGPTCLCVACKGIYQDENRHGSLPRHDCCTALPYLNDHGNVIRNQG